MEQDNNIENATTEILEDKIVDGFDGKEDSDPLAQAMRFLERAHADIDAKIDACDAQIKDIKENTKPKLKALREEKKALKAQAKALPALRKARKPRDPNAPKKERKPRTPRAETASKPKAKKK